MIPHLLRLQAFGPFAETEEINFDELGRQPLFLIYGATGAGKSTILDAICFALYGQTALKERDATQLRCQFSDRKLLTQIDLRFSLGDIQYRVERIPTQERPKERGDGTTLQQTRASLWQLSGETETLLVSRSATETTQTIEALTGLNAEQFRQIMVLPQGKFRDFLMADSNQREAIFSRLFQTEIYSRIEKTLKEKSSTIKRDIENAEHQKLGLLESIELNSVAEIEQELLQVNEARAIQQTEKVQFSEKVNALEKQIEKEKYLDSQFKLLEQLDHSLAELLKNQSGVSECKNKIALAEEAGKLEHEFQQKNKLVAECERLQKELDATQVASEASKKELEQQNKLLENITLKYENLSELTQKVSLMERQVADLQAMGASKSIYEASLNNEKDLSAKVDNIKLSLVEKEKSIKTLEEDIELSHAALAKQSEIEKKLAKLEQVIQHKKNHDEAVERKHGLDGALKIVKAKIIAQQQDVKKAERAVMKLEHTWHSGQAAILAEALKDDDPCPVCGSKVHPEPANLQTDFAPISLEDVRQKKQELSQLQETFFALDKEQDLLLSQQETLAKIVETALPFLYENGEYMADGCISEKEILVKEQSNLQRVQERLNGNKSKIAAQKEALHQTKEDLEKNQHQLTSLKIESSLLQKDYLSLAEQFTGIEDHTAYAVKLARELDKLQKEIEQIKNSYHTVKNQTDTLKHQLIVLTTRQEEQSKQLNNAIEAHAQAVRAFENVLSKSLFHTEQDFVGALLEKEALAELRETVRRHETEVARVNANIEHMQSQLSKVEKPDLAISTKNLEVSRVELAEVQQKWQKTEHRFQSLSSVQKKIVATMAAIDKLNKDYSIYGTLSDVSNGQNAIKISLQRFVLSVLLDEVLVEASSRLYIMSSGRYQLIRKDEKSKGNKASGLELEIDDAYTGLTRPISTLSGGESFIAALALALGLSDVVQAYSGGIRLDTLFVDEGFGSLDQDSLELAIKILIDLQKSGRMIGIISHVSELHSQMPLRIEVEKTVKGSHVLLKTVA